MPFVDTPELRIHYRTAGSGPVAVVFVHGNFATSAWWQPILEHLPPGIVAYAPDLRGCGQSGRTMLGYDMPQLSGDLRAFTEALQLDAFHLVGQSLGGAVALQFALDCAERTPDSSPVLSLLLMAPVPANGLDGLRDNGGDEDPQIGQQLSQPEMTAHLTLFTLLQTTGLYGLNKLLLRRAIAQMTPKARLFSPSLDDLVEDAAQISPAALVGFYRAVEQWNVRDRLSDLNLPTTILWGEKDSIVPLKGMQDTVARLPRGKLVICPELGHAPQFEFPDKVVELMMQVITRDALRQRLGWYAWRLRRLVARYVSKRPGKSGQQRGLVVRKKSPTADG